jgi:Zn-dependent M28 family amino/carboxypeptidase
MHRQIVFILGTLWAFSGCGTGCVNVPEFDGNRAYEYLVAQAGFGPRVPGSTAWSACRQYLCEHFDTLGLEVDSQVFSFTDPYTQSEVPLVNVIVRHRGDPDESKGVILLAHYDSRPRAERDTDPEMQKAPILGANDGASGVAVLMELANMLSTEPPDCNIDIVLADGEDWGKPGDDDYYLLGSRHFAGQGIRDKYYFGLVVDMVGDRNQQIFREEFTERFNKPVNDVVWETAAELGVTTFQDTIRYAVKDDHISLSVGGVPTAVIVDFDYPYWHTSQDTPDKCAPQSLTNVGRVVAQIIYNESLWPGK